MIDEELQGRSANHPKRQRNPAAFAHIAKARAAGFPIEAIMICESVISDRLVSYFVRQREAGRTISNGNVRAMLDGASIGEDGKHISTSHLVRSLEAEFDDLGEKKFERLPERLRKWMDDRNRAAHAFVKTHPFTKSYKEPLDEFIERLDTCAETGTGLARTLDAWTRRKGVIARTPPTP